MTNYCKNISKIHFLKSETTFLAVKLSFILMLVASLNVVASDFAQNINLSKDIRNTSIKEVLKTIEIQSSYRFFYSDDFDVLDKKVTLKAQNTDIKAILDQVFNNMPVSVQFMEGDIVVMKPLAKQVITVTGTVTDNGEPLPGVNISVKGTSIGVVSDVNGKYTINVPNAESVLLFSFVGYVTSEITVGDRREISIALSEDAKQLDEVVVVGYGTQKKVNLTGAVSMVKVDETLSSRSIPNVSSGLQGLVPGLSVTQNSGMAGNNSSSLVIRGLGTVNNADPLIVVDDMPDVDINRLNMNDIESISILKDATSSAVYGSRAANGVILIKTKSGMGQDKTHINFTGSYGWEKPTNPFHFMADYPRALTLHQQSALVNTAYNNLYFKNGTIDQWMALGMIDPLNYPNTDWFDVVMRTGKTQNYNLSASGGNDRSNFFASIGLMDEEGLQIKNNFTRYNARFNYDYKVRKNINLGVRFAGNWSKYQYALKDGLTDDSSTNTAGYDLQYAIAGITPYDPITGYYGGVMAYNEDPQAYNPYTTYVNTLSHQDRQEVNASLYGDWEIFKGFVARVDYALNYYNQFRWQANTPNRAYNFQTNSFGSRTYVGENAGVNDVTDTGYKTLLNARLNYNTTIASHHDLGVMFVYSEEYWFDREQTTNRNDRIHPSLHEVDAALTKQQTTGGYSTTEGLRSFIGRINYVAYDKYLLEFNLRSDGSSKFLSGNQYGIFPSIALGWRFTEEGFVQSVTKSWLTSGKLRASYGSLGNNSGVKQYEQQATLAANHYMIAADIAKGLVNRKIYNPDLTWESTIVLNLGLDLSFLNGRLATEIDYYDRKTTDMLRPSDLSILLSGAYDAPRQNIGEMRNRGVEINITWRDKAGQFSYMVNANASYNKTTLEKWNEYLPKNYTTGTPSVYYFIGMPVNYVYAYQDGGIAQTWQDIYDSGAYSVLAPGDILRYDLNGDGSLSNEDKKAYANIQRSRPTTNFALNGSVSWKGIDLSVLFQGSAGRKDFWINAYNNVNFGNQRYASTWDHWYNAWSWENRNGSWPRLNGNSSTDSGNRSESTFWLDNMAYLRMKNLQVGYNLPKRWLQRIKLDNLRVYGSFENLFTITNYRGLDPEKTGNKSDAYPLSKTYSIGINIGI